MFIYRFIKKNKKKIPQKQLLTGFTIVEIIVSLAIFSIILIFVSAFFFTMSSTNFKTKNDRENLESIRRVLDEMAFEIKSAKSIYIPTSTPHQLSLETARYLPSNETSTYIDFFLCGTAICLKKEFQDPIVLTTDNIKITNMTFLRIFNDPTPSIKINLMLSYADSTDSSDISYSVDLTSSAAVRIESLLPEDTPNSITVADHVSVIKLDSTHFVVGYADIGSSGFGSAKVGTVNLSDGSISYGPKYVFRQAAVGPISLIALDSAHFVAGYADASSPFTAAAVVGVVSGNAISFGAEQTFASIYSGLSLAAIDSTHFVAGYNRNSTVGDNGNAIIGTVSGNTISFGAEYAFGRSNSFVSLDILDAAHFVVAYESDNTGTARIGTISGNTINYYDFKYNFVSSPLYFDLSLTALDSAHFIIGYHTNNNSISVMGTVIGSAITYGPEYILNLNAGSFTNDLSLAALNSTSFVAAYADMGNNYYGTARVGAVSGSAISYGSEYVFNSGYIGTFYHSVSAVALDSAHFIVGYTDGDNNNYYGAAVLGTISGNAITFGAEHIF